jgi:hypothetical protein
VSPFVFVFAISVFLLVHVWLPRTAPKQAAPRVVSGLSLPIGLEQLSGRQRVEALKPVFKQAGVVGEIGWIQHVAKENLLIAPVTMPGRITTVHLDLTKREASIEHRGTGLADAIVTLHKSPGPHLVDIRMNWFPMRVWSWFADGSVYLLILTSVTGLYLWFAAKVDRVLGNAFLAAGAFSFATLIYAILR